MSRSAPNALAAGDVATAVLFGVVVLAELRAHGEAPEKPNPPI
ncbi:hypothetical protein [Micromonospora sp. NPDC047738]